jgi:DNA-binding Lrp family transcriptional regulator
MSVLHEAPILELYRKERAIGVKRVVAYAILCMMHSKNAPILRKTCMDEFDIKLLDALQADGRLTNNDLADRVGLSPSQCSRRRTALEDAGIIESYHAVLASEALGLDVLVFVQVTLATHSPDTAQAFAKLISGLEQVQEAYSLTGEADYLVKMAVPDLKTLSRILSSVFLPHRSVAHVRSSVVLNRVKQTARLPLSHLPRTSAAQADPPARRSRASANTDPMQGQRARTRARSS